MQNLLITNHNAIKMKREFIVFYIATANNRTITGNCTMTCTSNNGISFLNNKSVVSEISRMAHNDKNLYLTEVVVTNFIEVTENEIEIWSRL